MTCKKVGPCPFQDKERCEQVGCLHFAKRTEEIVVTEIPYGLVNDVRAKL